MPPPVHHHYVYYRVDPAAVEDARLAVEAFQSEVERRTGVRGRRLQRRDEPLLWMEIYENVPADTDLGTLLSAGSPDLLRRLAPGARRIVETFLD